MSTLTSLARAYAVDRDCAQPITTVRHVHISDRPMVCVPLTLAGEANAPLAVMVGVDRDAPRLWVVPQPRDRNLRIEFAQHFAMALLHYCATYVGSTGGKAGSCADDAPQLWVPNRAGIGFLNLLGRSTRFRSTTGPHAVGVAVPRLGTWLTFFAEQAEHPGSSLLMAATDALGQHWATGQSGLEDGNLAALLGWIEPHSGSGGAQSALEAEDPLLWPPAGPTTDPMFDREVLAPSIVEYDRASSDHERRRAITRIETAVRSQLVPTWQLMWRAVDQLRCVRPGAHVAQRWAKDIDAFQKFNTHVAAGGRPQPKRDSAVAAAHRLNWLERLQAEYDAQRAFDDPLVMAEFRLTGEAFAGVVTAVASDRRVGSGRQAVLRPVITVLTQDPVRLVPGDGPLTDSTRPRQQATVVSIDEVPHGLEVTLELAGGMGRSRIAPVGSIPAVNERVCFSTLSDSYQPRGSFPTRDSTPWTHGGPPTEPTPTSNDANEDWS
ncbi:hypothetical protein OG874_35560 [Nocardia sp. NBC_00565]|uniref:hypothetical protein n=1 Tax=Nocardia sp. NBC_00565 TaxID=2975993 RepID=UPI002E8199F5|nr:hypothetical protein [Nocardia sp. NBC_00565]WUC02008.1 hypothetical protein OG874_35560 [Nocardia sp. NBC_00565]